MHPQQTGEHAEHLVFETRIELLAREIEQLRRDMRDEIGHVDTSDPKPRALFATVADMLEGALRALERFHTQTERSDPELHPSR